MKKSLILSLVLCGVGCGVDASVTPPPTEVDKSVWSSSATALVVQDHGGGFAPQSPPGSKCVINAQKYTLTVGARKLDWTRCVVVDTMTPYKEESGSRILTDAELKDLGSVLGNLRVVKATGSCIADASMLTVDITNPSGSQEYVDDGFQCTVKDKPYLDRGAISQVMERMNKLAVPTS